MPKRGLVFFSLPLLKCNIREVVCRVSEEQSIHSSMQDQICKSWWHTCMSLLHPPQVPKHHEAADIFSEIALAPFNNTFIARPEGRSGAQCTAVGVIWHAVVSYRRTGSACPPILGEVAWALFVDGQARYNRPRCWYRWHFGEVIAKHLELTWCL